jgi:hypothetical protein
MNQIAQNTVDETVPVSTLEANTTETKTNEETHTGRQKQTFLGIQRVDRAKLLLHHLSDTSDSVEYTIITRDTQPLRIFDSVDSQKEFYESFNENS